MTEEQILKPPAEWEALEHVQIRDEDGWRRDGKPFDEPITRDEFLRRMAASTTRFLPGNTIVDAGACRG